MKHFGRLLIAVLLSLLPQAAAAQQFPTVPSGTVIGRTQVGIGPAQAIPFSQLLSLFTNPNAITNGMAAQMAANTVKGNNSGVTANQSDMPMPSCGGGSNALTWTTSSGFGCNVVGSSAPWGNVRLAKVVNYTAVSNDCGSTIALGGSAFFTLTLSAASGYLSTCVFYVVNEDAGRGKTLAISGYSNFILWPQQTAIVYGQNGVWRVISPGRWRLPADQTLYVDVNLGSDSNDGLASGSGALASLQKSYDNAADLFDFAGHTATYNVAAGGYSTGINSQKGLVGVPYLGLIYQGAGDTTFVNTASTSAFKWFEAGGVVSVAIKNMKLNAGGSADCIWAASAPVYAAGYGLNFAGCGGVGIRVYNGAEFDMLANFTISGTPGAGIFVFTNANGISSWQGLTVTLTGTPGFSQGFANANGGQILIQGNTYSGASTGVKCSVSNLGLVDTGNAVSGLPGATGCTRAVGSLSANGGYIN